MGRAFECDRCGDFESGTPLTRVQYRHDDPSQNEWRDLCSTCGEKVRRFMEGDDL